MKMIKSNGNEYVLKFGAGTIANLNDLDITLMGLSQDMEAMKVKNLYTAFYHGLKQMHHDMTLEQAYKVIDGLFDEGMELEDFFKLVLEEYSKAMGLGKKFMEIMNNQVEAK